MPINANRGRWTSAHREPLCKAICLAGISPTRKPCDRMKAEGLRAEVQAKTGLLLDPISLGSKKSLDAEKLPSPRGRRQSGPLARSNLSSFFG